MVSMMKCKVWMDGERKAADKIKMNQLSASGGSGEMG